ncbi:MAG: glycoside hydrolase family 5 protein [Brasilonema sp.]
MNNNFNLRQFLQKISLSVAYNYHKGKGARLWRQLTKRVAAGLALILLYTILSSCSPPFPRPFDMTRSEAATTIVPPLSTRDSQIVDANGRVVLLRGVNWFGIEQTHHVPHGLWVRNYKDMLAQMKSLGYNVIRLPYSVQALRSRDITGVDFSISANKDLQGKTPIEVMDIIIQEAQRQGLFILLDSHTLKDDKISELWYGDGFTEKDWIDTWTLLAKRYKGYTNVIGADLKNEPHGRASWGTGDKATDWRLAAQRAGNEILSVNSKWLILVEGVEKNVPGQKQSIYFWGGNLEGVRKYPVRLKVSRKLVYSPHEYGTSDLPWLREPTFPSNLYKRWETAFQYIATQGIAPIWIGEFGGYHVDLKSKEGIWQRKLVDYIDHKKLSFTYWCWNPNSKGTGGLLLDDWKSINTDKQKLLSQLLR